MRRTRWFASLVVAAAVMALAPSTASAACTGYRSALAGITFWATSKSDCGVIGHTGYRQGYTWTVAAGSNTRMCVQGYGFAIENGRYVGRWFSLGCGTGGSGTVPWGNMLALPKVRAKVQLGFIGGAYRWAH